ncbi:hypothetical protein EZI54_16940 [Marinobacter halodurans]|uniref:Uncharacterized protein n=1 Tax=Marinobacter halodurans TaxID=2528979 RepID=A0ABY1ZGY9_9GAMM|nr:hypothetical protein [Marinobacter halodurans]TBW51560.1 hypothetical protein EZI54_16940 [Marinobacter halodurans]
MQRAVCQQALDRLIAYLRGCGVEITSENCRKALRLVDRALETGSHDVMARAMDMIPDYFDLPPLAIPQQSPSLMRGSIGYHPYV